MRKIDNIDIFLFFVIVLAVLFDSYLLINKDYFHVDEIFSYGASNSDIGWRLFLNPVSLDDNVINSDIIKSYLFPLDGSFIETWKNSALDVHPPLYFLGFRFFCLLFNDNLIFPALIFNTLSLVGILIAFYKISFFVFYDKEKAVISTGIFAFTSNFISLVIFVRMYILLLLFSLWFLYYACKYLFEDKYKNLILCFVFAILSFLTHFYSYIFVFCVTLVICFIFLLEKKYIKLLILGIIMLFSVLISYLIFPSVLNIIFKSSRGVSFVGLIFSEIVNNPLLFFKKQMPLFYETIFGSLGYMVLFFIIFFLGMYLGKKKCVIEKRYRVFVFLFFSIFSLYSILLTLNIPTMRPYQVRYFTPIIPIFVILNIYIMFLFFRILNFKRYIMYVVFIFNMIVCVYNFDKNPFYMPEDNTSIKLKNVIKNNDVWWAFGGSSAWAWMLYMYMDKFVYADKIWSINDFYNENFVNFSNNEKNKGKYAYLFVYSWWEDKKMNIVENPIEVVKKSTNRQAYYLFTVNVMVFKADVYLICPF